MRFNEADFGDRAQAQNFGDGFQNIAAPDEIAAARLCDNIMWHLNPNVGSRARGNAVVDLFTFIAEDEMASG